MITKKYNSDFTELPSKAFDITLVAPNGDTVTYPGLSGEQAEQLWRLYQATGSADAETLADVEWDFRWAGSIESA
jgi:hypothetical protein